MNKLPHTLNEISTLGLPLIKDYKKDVQELVMRRIIELQKDYPTEEGESIMLDLGMLFNISNEMLEEYKKRMEL